jgi:hypothetical protein
VGRPESENSRPASKERMEAPSRATRPWMEPGGKAAGRGGRGEMLRSTLSNRGSGWSWWSCLCTASVAGVRRVGQARRCEGIRRNASPRVARGRLYFGTTLLASKGQQVLPISSCKWCVMSEMESKSEHHVDFKPDFKGSSVLEYYR